MIDAVVRESPDGAEDNSDEPTADDLSELRGILLAPEQLKLNDLNERLNNPARYAEEMSRALPDAFALRASRDNKLTPALMPVVEEAIGISVKKNPKRLVDAIFPVMGPAIRKAIANAFSEMVRSLNQTLEYSVSLKGLKWRLEALRTGKTFAEVVLARTLLYRVEQVFLIHRETGLLLEHAEAGAARVQDVDVVSGMLTAIQDFVRDSFGAADTDHLDSMQVGDLTVWIERGPHAVLAVVIRGTAPMELRRLMLDALDSIHVEHPEALETFTGDASVFASTRPHLESCIQQQAEDVVRSKPSPLLWIFAAVIVAALGVWAFFSIRASSRWDDYLSRLRAEPGIVVVSAERRGGKYAIVGLRDPLAADPAGHLKTAGIDPGEVEFRFEPYQSTEFVARRAETLLQPPGDVSLSFDDGVLSAYGSAPHDWIVQARRLVIALPGVVRLGEDELVDTDLALRELETVKAQIQQRSIRFAIGSSELTSDQSEELGRVISDIRRLELLGRSRSLPVRVVIQGHADHSGSEEINQRLISERAGQVLAALSALGANRAIVVLADASKRVDYTRSVTFRVAIDGAAGANK
jgi:OOP family OmpA-OmpF porin